MRTETLSDENSDDMNCHTYKVGLTKTRTRATLGIRVQELAKCPILFFTALTAENRKFSGKAKLIRNS
jgi:hypothetical protein